MLGELKGYRSVRAAGQRYRVIFKVRDKTVIVIIVAVGMRKGRVCRVMRLTFVVDAGIV